MEAKLKFDDIQVSTKTFIVKTNLEIDIKKLFEFLPVMPYEIIPKRRGRKKKVLGPDPNRNIPNGSIITLDLVNNIRGVCLKKKKRKENKSTNYFRNALTVVMIVDKKKINFKISGNGMFQMTGCKFDKQAEDCIKFLWECIKDTEPEKGLYKFHDPNITLFRALFIPAMRNIDFTLGFSLDRERLDQYFNNNTDYYSLFETSIGYTGVNIKIPVSRPITSLSLKELIYKGEDWYKTRIIPYSKYLSTLKPREQRKKLECSRYTSFLVFQSGKTICSAMCEEFAREAFYEFMKIIEENKEKFRENLTFSQEQRDALPELQ